MLPRSWSHPVILVFRLHVSALMTCPSVAFGGPSNFGGPSVKSSSRLKSQVLPQHCDTGSSGRASCAIRTKAEKQVALHVVYTPNARTTEQRSAATGTTRIQRQQSNKRWPNPPVMSIPTCATQCSTFPLLTFHHDVHACVPQLPHAP